MSMREMKYSEALAHGTLQAMEKNKNIFLIGEGIDDPKGAFGTTLPALKAFGKSRVYDSPLSEAAMTGMGIGAAIAGHPNVMIHMRSEFLLYAMDQIINHAAKWHYMFDGQMTVPITIRCIVGRGWGQAAQHSQSFHAMFSHVPGLKVILPATPQDAKGLLYSAILDPNPVICIEHRWLYDKTMQVEEEPYATPIGKAKVVAEGKHITCVALSHQVYEALEARELLLQEGIVMEVIDLRSIQPWDKECVLHSVRKTGRLLVADIGHAQFGVSAEIISSITESAFDCLLVAPARIALPFHPTPCSPVLEDQYYPSVQTIVEYAKHIMGDKSIYTPQTKSASHSFVGPF